MATKKTEDKPEAPSDEVETHESPLQSKPETMTTDALAASTHPKAPELPLEVPKAPLSDAFDTAEPAPKAVDQVDE